MAADPFERQRPGLESPGDKLLTVTPSDATDLPGGLCRFLHVRGAGTVAVVDRHGNAATLEAGAGSYHPIRAARVMATGTTATGIVAGY